MGRTRQRRSQEKALGEALTEALLAGVQEGQALTFERILLAAAKRVLGLEERDTVQALHENGLNDVLSALAELARGAWRDRWKVALDGPIAHLAETATEEAAPIFGSFDLQNPKMHEWLDEYTSELADTLSSTSHENAERVVREAMDEGLSVPQTAARLRERLPEINRSRSELIARTETIRAANGASLVQAKESGIVSGKTWLATRDERVRLEHLAMHGMTVGIDEEFPNGEQFPGEPNCRCTLTWELDFEALDVAQDATIDPHGEGVVYEPRMGVIFVEQPPTPTPSEADLEALRKAYPEAAFLLWGNEDITLKDVQESEAVADAREEGEGLEAVEERLRSLGIPEVSVGSDADAANMVADGLERVAAKGVAMPDELVVDSAPFDEEYGSQSDMVPARVLAGRGRVVMQFNPRAEGWSSPEAASRKSAEQREAGFWSSDDPLHPIYHEAAHGAHFKRVPSEYVAYENELDPEDVIAQRLREVGGSVSRYAQRNIKEFVAEVFAGLMSGREYGPDTMRIYQAMGGPAV